MGRVCSRATLAAVGEAGHDNWGVAAASKMIAHQNLRTLQYNCLFSTLHSRDGGHVAGWDVRGERREQRSLLRGLE